VKIIIIIFISVVLSTRAFGLEEFDPSVFKVKVLNTPETIKILNSGLASFEERLQMIERAEKTIDVEYYVYKADTAGKIFTQALIAKAKKGIRVRLMVDYFLVKNEITPFFGFELSSIGIEVKYFNPTSIFNLTSGQYRNHRKVLIIDGQEALTGGRNIADEYFDLSSKFNFLDRDIVVKGPIVKAIQATYDAIWNSSVTKKIARDKKPKESQFNTDIDSELDRFEEALRAWEKLEKNAQDFISSENDDTDFVARVREKGKKLLQLEYQGECLDMTFNSEYPLINYLNRTERIINVDLYQRIKNSKKTVMFDSPYFIEERESAKALQTALNNGVDIKILTNGLYSTDAIYVFDVFDSIISKWLRRGVDPYVFSGKRPHNYDVLNNKIANSRFGVHAKSFIFDDRDVVIGTFNFDPRSSNYNTEMMVSCDNNPQLATIIKEDIEMRMKASMHIDSQKAIANTRFYRVSFFKALAFLLLKLPSNFFEYLL
jgi:putative cardiolipin synthase